MSTAGAICWWVSFVFVQNGRPPFKRQDKQIEYPDEATARRHRAKLNAQWGEDVVAVVSPIWPKPADGTNKAAKRAALEVAGMPVQLSPRAIEKRERWAPRRQSGPGKS